MEIDVIEWIEWGLRGLRGITAISYPMTTENKVSRYFQKNQCNPLIHSNL